MLAVDTNVIVRFLTNDHPQQSKRARTLVDGNDVWVSLTVLLETEWVLRSVYRYPPTQIIASLRDFAGLTGVSLENPALADRALTWCAGGMDFADALHLSAAADRCEAFVTFDAELMKAGKKATELKLREP
ncbi:MAG: type II toxin-antitoxin system VapC family toxin [Alphaproteobacteria bacterium]|nr:type II toxin-antitoxin system VapC family toxin [Alphaproteobacteria bacterium]